ncbi:MAG: glycosyltransferase family 87 protein, partial [Cyclobacteriaceae bacterium]
TERTDHLQLIGLLSLSFVLAYLLYRSSLSIPFLLVAGILLRLMLFFMFPNLSDDVYRFIWDGQLLAAGMDPFAHLPSEIAASGNFPAGTGPALFEKLNSPDYFTVYPPLMQYIFLVSARIAGEDIFCNVLLLRLIIILAEIGIFYVFYRKDPANRNVLFYALNPAVILEFTGNLHFEALMLFLLVACAWYFAANPVKSGLSFGMAAGVKLVPFIFGPILVFSQVPKRWVRFFGAMILALLLIVIPLFGQNLLGGIGESLALYFNKFEFNASIYYVIRAIGYWRFGYNDIAFIGPFLAWTSLIVIVILSWRLNTRRDTELLTSFGVILTAYLFLATTVHPWYVATAAGLMVLSRLRYAAVWSYTEMFSYIGYTQSGYDLNEFWLILEYI